MTRHIAGIVEDVSVAVRFYREALGLNVEHEEGAGYALVDVQGTLHFGIWVACERGRGNIRRP